MEHADIVEQIEEQIKIRDKRDSERKNAPLKCAKDALEVDTSNLTIDQVVDVILKSIQKD